MATFKIGGKDYEIRPLNFHWQDKVWPQLRAILDDARRLEASGEDVDPMAEFGRSIDAILDVVAAGLDQERTLTLIEAEERGEPIDPVSIPVPPTKERLRMKLTQAEQNVIHVPLLELLQESGMQLGEILTARAGATAPEDQAESPSTETSTD